MNLFSKHPLAWKYRTLFIEKGINTPLRLAHFFAQNKHEANLKPKRESLNYSVAGLINTFGRHRITLEQANKYGRKAGQSANQRAIANIVYGGEWGKRNLGNIKPDDGWRFRGGGGFQTTGRYNYKKLSQRTGIDFENNPELIETEVNSLIAAIDYWNERNLNHWADQDNVLAISQIINFGSRKGNAKPNGWNDRVKWANHYKKLFQ